MKCPVFTQTIHPFHEQPLCGSGGDVLQNELALALKQHGYEIEPKAHGQFELKGYSPELLKAFSTRRQQILKLIEEWEATGS